MARFIKLDVADNESGRGSEAKYLKIGRIIAAKQVSHRLQDGEAVQQITLSYLQSASEVRTYYVDGLLDDVMDKIERRVRFKIT